MGNAREIGHEDKPQHHLDLMTMCSPSYPEHTLQERQTGLNTNIHHARINADRYQLARIACAPPNDEHKYIVIQALARDTCYAHFLVVLGMCGSVSMILDWRDHLDSKADCMNPSRAHTVKCRLP